ncbi:MAG: 2-oxoacid:acceptor oxidoreductase family protein [Clostridia bacterium]|jgi:2-oxoglutarate ferredoxin oxidoreductase subunit gamma|nr:2-oxoacid:acceptor oxidoreductase family protein [Clostridia bacterium]
MGETYRMSCSGFGGQGVMALGKLIVYAGMDEGKEVSWVPSYGPEMRGGTANCSVIVSDEPIASPIVSQNISVNVVMNLPSFHKFVPETAKDGVVFVNSSIISEKVDMPGVKAYYIPANDIANELGNPRMINIIMLGAILGVLPIVKAESIFASGGAFEHVFGASKAKFIPGNKVAFEKGMECAKAQM